MTYKIILFDIDGVLIRVPYYFGRHLELRGYRDAEKILQDFYMRDYIPCALWKADIRAEILPTLTKLGWKKSVDDFFSQQFAFEIEYFEKEFLSVISHLRERNILCYLASSQEARKIEYLWNQQLWKSLFDGKYISCDIGHRKEDGKYWEYVLEDITKKYIKADEILLLDDSQKVIDMAWSFWIRTYLFTDIERFWEDVKNNILSL